MIDFEKRLKSLKDRRQGTRERVLLEKGYNTWDSYDFRTNESYEKLSESAGVKYAIGAMAAVDSNSTRVSKEEGERVADTLISSLASEGINAVKRMQGSVAMDIHIQGHSDVDMLIIESDTVLVQTPAKPGSLIPASDTRPMVEIIANLRSKSEGKLKSRYYQATVDCSKAKSIRLEGGSLKREVDIVPACWYNSHAYQESGLEHDRGVEIYDKKNHKLIGNLPFTHIKLVNDKDEQYGGNLKKVIRLFKNMVADMPDYKKSVAKNLSSYDLASIAYHMGNDLNLPSYMSLGLIEKARSHLAFLYGAHDYRNSLKVPDASRKIFDSNLKYDALEILYKEIDDLAVSIFKELRPYIATYDSSVLTNKVV